MPSTPRLWQQCLLRLREPILLSSAATHHARNVLRLQIGSRFSVFNEQHGEWLAEVVSWQGSEGEAICLERLRAPNAPEPDAVAPRLYFSAIRAHRLKLLIAGAVELGVSSLIPYRSAYTNARFSPERVSRMIVSSVEQSNRLSCPELKSEQQLSESIIAQEKALLFCAESGAARKLRDAISGLAPDVKSIAIMIGPEGGFSEVEHAMLRANPKVIPVSLGKRVLRCETAALAAIACWQAMAGDW